MRPHRESRRLRSVCSAWEGIDDVDYRRRRKPVGGFLFLTVTQLSMAWWCYQKRLIQLKDLRVWFAAQELVARRCQMKGRQRPRYGMEELRQLVAGRGGEGKSVRRLERLGLLAWDASHIAFALTPADLQLCDVSALHEMLSRIQNNRRKVPVPRQVVRFIAAPSKRCVIATILGHLIRCLYYRAGECRSGGFCKASWVAEVFHIDVRNVKAARKFLAGTLGLLEFVQTPQSLLNRFGQKAFVNLSWNGSAVDKSSLEPSESPPPLAQIDQEGGKDSSQKLTDCCMSGPSNCSGPMPYAQLQLDEQQKRTHPTALSQYVRELPDAGVLSTRVGHTRPSR